MFKGLIKRPVAVIMVLIAVQVLGIAAIRLLPVSLVPDIDIPQITVQVNSPGKSARELHETMMTPLRNQLVQVDHLTDMECETKDGNGRITMTFDYGVSSDYIFIDVNERIDRCMNGWPRDEERPAVIRANATDIPAFFLNITLDSRDTDFKPDDINTVSPKFIEMSDFSRQVIVRRLEQLPQVAMVDITGLVFPELLIVPDMEKLLSMGLSEQDLATAIQNANVRLGNLTIRDGEYRFNVRFESSILTKEDIENVFLKLHGRVCQIKDLASVHEHPQRRTGLVTSQGKPAISLAVIKRTEAKMADLKRGVNELMEAFEHDYPDLDFEVIRDQTELLDYSINNMVNNLLWGGLFACLIIFFFMQDFRSPILVALTIPLSLIFSFLFFYLFGITINIISLSGLVLGLGMMVDNSIIVTDNITRRWKSGESLDTACVGGAREVFAPMLSSVLTTCAIFVPLIFLSGISGALFYDQAMAVSITLFSALLVSVLVIPVFYFRFYRKQPCFRPNRWIQRVSVGNMNVGYDRLLFWFFRHRGVMWAVFAVSALLTAYLFFSLEKRKLPELSHSDALVYVEWNQRITAEDNSLRCQRVVDHFSRYASQSTVMAGVQQFLLPHTQETGVTEAIIYIQANSADDIKLVESEVGEYIHFIWPDAVCSCKSSGNLFDMIFAEKEAPLVAKVRAADGGMPDPALLSELLNNLNSSIPQARVQAAEWNEHIELIAIPEMLTLYDVSYHALLSHLQKSLNDNSVMRVAKGNLSLPVVMGDNKTEIKDLVQNNYIYRYDGSRVPLEVLLRETHNKDLKKITSGVDGEYYSIEINLPKRRQIEQVMEIIRKSVRDNIKLDVDFSGSYFSNKELVRELCMVLAISVLLLFFILAAQFESLVQPLIILSELVIDIFGSLLMLRVCGESINIMSLIGVVVMCGIVINDSILKVDTINRLRREGMGLKRSIIEAGARRLKAILMTSLTTILAIAPFLVRGSMGNDLQYPLSLTLISGMVVGTFVSVFFIPLAYYSIERHRGKQK